jgi:hypothetical protein
MTNVCISASPTAPVLGLKWRVASVVSIDPSLRSTSQAESDEDLEKVLALKHERNRQDGWHHPLGDSSSNSVYSSDPTIQWIKIAERLIYNSPTILEKLKFRRCRRPSRLYTELPSVVG